MSSEISVYTYFFLVLILLSAKSFFNGKMLNFISFCPNNSQSKVSSDKAVSQSGARCTNSLVLGAHDHENLLILSLDFLQLKLAIHSTLDEKRWETLTSMSSMYSLCLFFSSLLTMFCRLPTICTHE